MPIQIITEIIEFKTIVSVPNDQVIEIINKTANDFHKKQDGFISSELVKGENDYEWLLIHHYESIAKIKALGEKIGKCRAMDEFKKIIKPGSVNIRFLNQVMTW